MLLPLLFAIVIGLTGAALALILVPTIVGVDAGVRMVSERLEEEGNAFRRLPAPPERSVIYANDGKTVLATVFLDENRDIVKLGDVRPLARKAVLAIEDRGFYEHGPLSGEAVLRAMLANIGSGGIVQGGSTITQQLVKNTLIDDPDDTYARKIQEAALAIRMERRYSKDEILELYLNEVYFGNGVYGIGTAADYYFGRPAGRLTLAQSATLAGMVASPETYDPTQREKASRRRRNLVLDEMEQAGWAKAGEVKRAKHQPIEVAEGAGKASKETRPFIVKFVTDQILDMDNPDFDVFGQSFRQREHTLFQGGLRITTTLDPNWQTIAQRVAQRSLPDTRRSPDTSIVSVQTGNGAIRTLLSGKNYDRDEFRLATSNRQPGSAFKPYTLVAAFRENIPPSTTYPSKSPVRIKGWDNACHCVQNAEGASNRGILDLWEATQGSVNTVFAQLVMDVGAGNVARAAHDMGVTAPLVGYPSITLGAEAVSPLDMASGFQTLANHGEHCEPFAIARVEDPEEVLYRHRTNCEQVISQDIAHLVTAMLERVVQGGTGTAAALGRPVAGKTGTTQDSTDVWFVGFTPQVSTAVWVGLPGNPRDLHPYFPGQSVFGGTIAAPIWQSYMAKVMAGFPVQNFAPAPRLERGNVPNVVGMFSQEARKALERAEFRSQVQHVASTKREGVVVAQAPGGGSSAGVGTIVTIEVSTGQPPREKVPNVVGRSARAARATLTASGFKVRVERQQVAQGKKVGIVLAQSPGGGGRAREGAIVTLTVGSKPGGNG
jgi:membrane peptidoglycan carboxypeptidase